MPFFNTHDVCVQEIFMALIFLLMFKVKLLSPEGISLAANNAPSVLEMDCESVDDSYQHDEVTEDNDYIITTNESQVRLELWL